MFNFNYIFIFGMMFGNGGRLTLVNNVAESVKLHLLFLFYFTGRGVIDSNYKFEMKKLVCIVLLIACRLPLQAQADTTAIVPDQTAKSFPDSFTVVGKPISGMAGMFSSKADGFKTASGEIFNNKEFTAACNKFKFGTWIRITNLKNKKTVLVRINDRTSKKKTAPIVELSRVAVAELGYLKTGKANIKLEEVSVNTLKSGLYSIPNILPDTIITDKKKNTETTSSTYQTKGKPISGIASFYSANLDGTKTATGELYRNKKLTAASNNFNLNSLVLVTNPKNNKSVIVRINDRMHPRMKKKGRIVDLSGSAAQALDILKAGLAKVRVQEIVFIKEGPPELPETDSLTTISTDSTMISDSAKAEIISKKDVSFTGLAGFYGADLEGTKASSGEIYKNVKLTAISNQFEIGSNIKVINPKNKKSVIVRVIDHFPKKTKNTKKLLDLSKAAGKKLDFTKNTLHKVKVEEINQATLN